MKRIKNTRGCDAAWLRSCVLQWYDDGRRDLPWRRSRNPYHIWVSEIMLQQTRVETVLPYYERWLARFPSLDSLAAAELPDVLKQWEGLGYYSRARHLHRAAQVVRERFNSRPPASYDVLRELPGVGDYTAGAISSIAYNQPQVAIDGNVRRVLSRLFDVPAPNASAVRPLAEAMLDRERPGDFNQALMELGARVCSARNPSCARCPLRSNCLAHEHGTVLDRPGRSTQRRMPHVHVNTLVTLRNDRVILAQRPSEGLLASLWEFPQVKRVPRHAQPLGEITHTFSHKRITYCAYISVRARTLRNTERWVALADLQRYALPRAQRRIESLIPPLSPNPLPDP